ncbi:MAG: RND transporter [bacterium]|nr:MAG: RND transporter [bacterium]
MVDQITTWIKGLPWSMVVLACLTLGLAPFSPPHIWEKLHLLLKGRLIRPIDWLDLIFHGVPWLILIAKLVFRGNGGVR